jgi:isoleucyl-tRNA synthetase
VIVSGLILAEDGKKMSKRLKNYPAPEYVMEQYGADALRMYLIDSPVVRAEEMKFSEKGIKEILKSVIIPLWNVYNFFVEYAVTDRWDPKKDLIKNSGNELDQWILSLLQSLIKEVNLQMAAYNLFKVVPAIEDYIENLTNWYVRRSRQRFWSNAQDNPQEKKECHSTLYAVLVAFSKIIAPILPFLSEEIYQNLVCGNLAGTPPSVHLCDYPVVDESIINRQLEKRMALVRNIVGLGNALRSKHTIKNRQPLSEISVVLGEGERQSIQNYVELIREELNIKSIVWVENENALVDLSVKPNYRLLGKKFGKQMKAAASVIASLDSESIRSLEQGQDLPILDNRITIDELIVERTPRTDTALEARRGVTVGLNTEVTEALLIEGYAQEFKNRVNTMRKELGFDKEDRIQLFFQTASSRLKNTIMKDYRDFIKNETLSISVTDTIPGKIANKKDWKVYNENITIAIEKLKR